MAPFSVQLPKHLVPKMKIFICGTIKEDHQFNIILGDKKGNISLEIITCKKKVILKSKFTVPNQNGEDISNEIPWPILFKIDKDFDLTIHFKRDKYMLEFDDNEGSKHIIEFHRWPECFQDVDFITISGDVIINRFALLNSNDMSRSQIKMCDAWNEVSKSVELNVQILELNSMRDWQPAPVIQKEMNQTGGIYQLNLSSVKKINVSFNPVETNSVHHFSGNLFSSEPVEIIKIAIGDIAKIKKNSFVLGELDSYQENDLIRLKNICQLQLEKQQEIIRRDIVENPGRSENELLENKLQFLTELKTDVIIPHENLNLPGSPMPQWKPLKSMENFVPLSFLEYHRTSKLENSDREFVNLPFRKSESFCTKSHNKSNLESNWFLKSLADWNLSDIGSQYLREETPDDFYIYAPIKVVVRFKLDSVKWNKEPNTVRSSPNSCSIFEFYDCVLQKLICFQIKHIPTAWLPIWNPLGGRLRLMRTVPWWSISNVSDLSNHKTSVTYRLTDANVIPNLIKKFANRPSSQNMSIQRQSDQTQSSQRDNPYRPLNEMNEMKRSPGYFIDNTSSIQSIKLIIDQFDSPLPQFSQMLHLYFNDDGNDMRPTQLNEQVDEFDTKFDKSYKNPKQVRKLTRFLPYTLKRLGKTQNKLMGGIYNSSVPNHCVYTLVSANIAKSKTNRANFRKRILITVNISHLNTKYKIRSIEQLVVKDYFESLNLMSADKNNLQTHKVPRFERNTPRFNFKNNKVCTANYSNGFVQKFKRTALEGFKELYSDESTRNYNLVKMVQHSLYPITIKPSKSRIPCPICNKLCILGARLASHMRSHR